jgi:protein subunit release factor A
MSLNRSPDVKVNRRRMTGDGRQVLAKAQIAFVIQHMPTF